jgi:glycine/D-amino acid oxidase-like deaminating enzyme
MTNNRITAAEHKFMPGFLSHQENISDLPAETDVLIIGGGLLGTSLAYYLAKEQVEVVLVDRSELNREASGTNAGSFHFQIGLHQLTPKMSDAAKKRLSSEVKLQVDAAGLWDSLEHELNADLGVHFTGGFMVAETKEELDVLYQKQEIEVSAGLESHVLTGSDMHKTAPLFASDLAGIAYCPREGHANPLIVGPVYAYRAHQLGAKFRTYCNVDSVEVLEPNNNSTFRFKVHTSKGPILCRRVVNAAGAWTSELAKQLDFNLKMGLSGLHVNVTEPYDYVLPSMVQHIGRRLTLKQTTNNTFIIGGGWPSKPEIYPKRYSNYWSSTAGNLAVAQRVLPLLKDVKLVRVWSGVWAYTHDFKPILGESKRVPGYHIAMVPTGFTLGPMVSRMLAEYMASKVTINNIPNEFNVDR